MIERRKFLAGGSASALLGAIPRLARAAVSTDPPVRRLLLVHGRAQEDKDPEELKKDWLKALRRGAGKLNRRLPDGLKVDLPYYGDVLYKNVYDRSKAAEDKFVEFEKDVLEELVRGVGITDDQLNEISPTWNRRAKGIENNQLVLIFVRAIDRYYAPLSETFIRTFLRDVFAYSREQGLRNEIDPIVARSLTEEPTVVVAHSLGSEIAYNILRIDQRPLHIPLFVTVGCPLGIHAVNRRLKPRFPKPAVTAWKNAFDKKDVVALNSLDKSHFFKVSPVVENFGGVQNYTRNHHGIDGYLDDKTVAQWILDALG